jgi:hypothetical protein
VIALAGARPSADRGIRLSFVIVTLTSADLEVRLKAQAVAAKGS